jgi:serine protease Do
VTPPAVDSLQQHNPDAKIYVRGKALLGVQADDHQSGVLITRVEPGTAAAAAGIAPNDIVVSLGGHVLPDFDRLTARIAQYQPGDTVEVEVLRGTERKKLSVKLGSWAGQE